MTPRISVIMPAHNAELLIARATGSLLNQEFAAWEAVIVDDGSTDGTAAIAAALATREPRVRLVRQSQGGVSHARNTALSAATAQLGVFLDADDRIEPEHLGTLLSEYDKGGTDLVYCAYRMCRADGERSARVFSRDIERAPYATFASNCAVGINCVLFPIDLVRKVGGFDPALRTCEDWDLWIRLARTGARFRGVDAALATYHTSTGTLARNRRQLISDGLHVLRIARSDDGRLKGLTGQLQPADVPDTYEIALANYLFWHACGAILDDDDPAFCLEVFPRSCKGRMTIDRLANDIVWSIAARADYCYRASPGLWQHYRDRLLAMAESVAIPSGSILAELAGVVDERVALVRRGTGDAKMDAPA